MCGLYTRKINLKPYFLYSQHGIYSLRYFFGIFSVTPVVATLSTIVAIVIVTGVSVLIGDHTVQIAPASRPQRHQNRRHGSNDAPSHTIRSRASFCFADASSTVSDNDHLCRNHLVLLFLDLVLLIQSDLFGILGFFLSLSLPFLHGVFCCLFQF